MLLVGNNKSVLEDCHGIGLKKIPLIKKNCSVLTVPQQKYETKNWRGSGRAVRVWKEFDRTCGGKGSWILVWNFELEGRGRKPYDSLWGSLIKGSFYISFVFELSELFSGIHILFLNWMLFLITIVCFMQMNNGLKRKTKRNTITEKWDSPGALYQYLNSLLLQRNCIWQPS